MQLAALKEPTPLFRQDEIQDMNRQFRQVWNEGVRIRKYVLEVGSRPGIEAAVTKVKERYDALCKAIREQVGALESRRVKALLYRLTSEMSVPMLRFWSVQPATALWYRLGGSDASMSIAQVENDPFETAQSAGIIEIKQYASWEGSWWHYDGFQLTFKEGEFKGRTIPSSTQLPYNGLKQFRYVDFRSSPQRLRSWDPLDEWPMPNMSTLLLYLQKLLEQRAKRDQEDVVYADIAGRLKQNDSGEFEMRNRVAQVFASIAMWRKQTSDDQRFASDLIRGEVSLTIDDFLAELLIYVKTQMGPESQAWADWVAARIDGSGGKTAIGSRNAAMVYPTIQVYWSWTRP
jgi:hypothetical protein